MLAVGRAKATAQRAAIFKEFRRADSMFMILSHVYDKLHYYGRGPGTGG